MSPHAIRLKYLLQQRHWQTYRNFRSEYDKTARTIDKGLVGTWPSRAQFHRWLAGDLKGLPYPDHCRILESMLPEWSAEQLFELLTEDQGRQLLLASVASETNHHAADTANACDVEMFVDMTEEDNREIAKRIRTASDVFFVAHTGYNALVSQYQPAIREAVANGCVLRVVITDPDGPLMKEPELTTRLCPSIRQEGEIRDVLRTCSGHRDQAVRSGHPPSNVQARTYAGVPSMNALLVDGWLRVIPYLPLVDAAESPVFEYSFDRERPSAIVAKYLFSMDRLWSDARPFESSP